MTKLLSSQLQEKINTVSTEYFELSMELATIAERSGVAWLELRKGVKTNAECEQLWRATADGRREQYLRIYLKGLQSLRGALILESKANAGNSW